MTRRLLGTNCVVLLAGGLAVAGAASEGFAPGGEARFGASGVRGEEASVVRGTVASADGVPIAYSACGSGGPVLVFIHGGFADQTFWRHQVEGLAGRFRVVTLDLAGHGESGSERPSWTLEGFGADVRAVVEGLGLDRVVLLGNSMGGPVALEAARQMPGRVAAVIAVDTLHDAGRGWDDEAWARRLEAFRDDFQGQCAAMVEGLFHPGTDPDLVGETRGRMCDVSGELAATILGVFTGYRMGAAMAATQVPIRAINGDLFPTDVEGNRRFSPTFDAVVMPDTGHYPMLERPDEFNRHVAELVEALVASPEP